MEFIYSKKAEKQIKKDLLFAEKNGRIKINEWRNFIDYDIIPCYKKLRNMEKSGNKMNKDKELINAFETSKIMKEKEFLDKCLHRFLYLLDCDEEEINKSLEQFTEYSRRIKDLSDFEQRSFLRGFFYALINLVLAKRRKKW